MSRLIEFRQIGIIAGKEFRDRIRNRWVLAVAAVFTVLALVIAYFGSAQQGSVGFHGVGVTIASLVSLVIYLVPLIALMLGFDAIVGERERGSLNLLLSLPITPLELLLGKFLGLSAALSLSTAAGFGLAGIALTPVMSLNDFFHYFGFIASSILLGMAFLGLAISASVLANDRASASGIAIALWFFLVLVFDLILLGVLVASGGELGDLGGALFPYLLLLDPADIYRILNIFTLDEVRTLYGLATVFPEHLSNPWLLGGVMVLWTIAPLSLAAWRFK